MRPDISGVPPLKRERRPGGDGTAVIPVTGDDSNRVRQEQAPRPGLP